MKYIKYPFIGFFCLWLIVFNNQLKASDPMGEIPILDRRFNDFAAKGFQLGRFKIYPSTTAGISYTSNVLQASDNEETDRIVSYGGAVEGSGRYDRINIDISGDIERLDYQDLSDWDRTNFQARVSASYDVSNSADIIVEARKLRSHQTLFENPVPAEVFDPVQIDENRFLTQLILKPASTQWILSGQYRNLSYEDTRLNSDNSLLVQRDRDRSIYSGTLKVSHLAYDGENGGRIVPFMGLNLTRAVYERRDFVEASGDFTGVDQDRTSYNAIVGVELNPTGKLRGAASLGYGFDDPDAGSGDSAHDVLVDIDLTYLYTPLTNFVFNVSRFFGTDNGNSEVILETHLSAQVIHELTRKWIFNAGLEYVDREFANDFDDQTFSANIGFDYKIGQNYSLNGDLKFIDRESNRLNGDFDETRAIVRIRRNF